MKLDDVINLCDMYSHCNTLANSMTENEWQQICQWLNELKELRTDIKCFRDNFSQMNRDEFKRLLPFLTCAQSISLVNLKMSATIIDSHELHEQK